MVFAFFVTLSLFSAASAVFTPAYRRSPVSPSGFDAKSLYFPCAPVGVHDEDQDITYMGQRCPGQYVGVEVYPNIKYAVETPLNKSGSSSFVYPGGSIVDSTFPYASCEQLPGLPYNLTYEHIADVEESGGKPIPEDCLTLSVFRPADLPDDLSVLISPDALEETHKRGLLPVTLILDESGPTDEKNGDEDDDDNEAEVGSPSSKSSRQQQVSENAAWIVSRDMDERATGRVIVVANYGVLDLGRRQRIFETLKAGLDDMVRRGESATANVCRAPAEFRRLQAVVRARNAAGPEPIEWPLYKSARGRGHADVLTGWIARNIHVWGGDPDWIQEVVILPEGAMTRTTTEPEWQARRLVKQEVLDKEMAAASAAGEGGGSGKGDKMIFNIPI